MRDDSSRLTQIHYTRCLYLFIRMCGRSLAIESSPTPERPAIDLRRRRRHQPLPDTTTTTTASGIARPSMIPVSCLKSSFESNDCCVLVKDRCIGMRALCIIFFICLKTIKLSIVGPSVRGLPPGTCSMLDLTVAIGMGRHK